MLRFTPNLYSQKKNAHNVGLGKGFDTTCNTLIPKLAEIYQHKPNYGDKNNNKELLLLEWKLYSCSYSSRQPPLSISLLE